MPTGLAQAIHLNTIVAAVQNVEANWATTTPQQRVNTIATAVTNALTAVGVHLPTVTVADLGGQLNGQFDFGPWTLQINTQMAEGDNTLTVNQRKETLARLGDVITHEARHCEQWWRMLLYQKRLMLDKDLLVTVTGLNNKMGNSCADAAVAAAINSATVLTVPERSETIEWYDSVYGRNSSFRSNVYGFGDSERLTRTGTEIGEARYESAFARYQRGLAEEEDAHQVGREIQTRYLAGSGLQPQGLLGHTPVSAGIQKY
jgi:hypothetical protein